MHPRDEAQAWVDHIRSVIEGTKPELLTGTRADRERALAELVGPERAVSSVAAVNATRSVAVPAVTRPWRLPDDKREPMECCVEAVEALSLSDRASLSFTSGMVLRSLVLPKLRPAFEIQEDDFQPSGAYAWLETKRELLRPRLRAVGRIRSDSAPYNDTAGTGFMVGSNLLMTNRHVAEYFTRGLGAQGLELVAAEQANCDLKQEWERNATLELRFERVVLLHPFWDLALIEVSGALDDVEPVEFMTQEPERRLMRNVSLVGYPVRQYLQPHLVDDRELVFRGIYDKKRLQPGQLTAQESYTTAIPNSRERRPVRVVGHDASTLAGNSGSAIFDLDSGAVVGVHYSGKHLVGNYAVPAWELARDPRLRDFGLRLVGPDPLAPDPEVEAAWAVLPN